MEPAEPTKTRESGAARVGRRVARFIVPLLLVVLVLVAYRSTLDAGFLVWDDDDHVYENPHITAVDGYLTAWRDWRNTAFYPLTFTTWFLEWRLADGNPWIFHLDNVVLHAANAVGVGLLARGLGLGGGVAWAAAGLWALDPVQVASVAWITERKNVLYVFFYLLALLAYGRSLEVSGSRSTRCWLLSLAAAVAALMSKATAVTLPIAILAFHWVRRSPFDRRAWLRVAAHLALAVAVGLLHVGREEVTADMGLGTRVLIAARAVWFYVGKFLWPTGLVAMYPRWSPEQALRWGLLPLMALVVVAAAAVWRRRRISRVAWFGGAWFAANIGLVVGIIWFPYMVHSFVADHLAYLASFGIAMLVAIAGAALFDWLSLPVPVRIAFVGAAWLALAGLTKDQTTQWRDTVTLWTRTLAVNPSSTTAHNNLGVALLNDGRRDEARAHFEASLRIDPDDAKAQLNLGVLAADREKWVEAIRYYQKALRQNPNNSFIWNNLGVAAAELHDLDRAVGFYERALEIDPDDATTHTNLGAALDKQGKYEEAVAHHETALRLNPRFMKAHYNLAMAHSSRGRYREAIPHFEAARELLPGDIEILTRLADAYSGVGDLETARAYLLEALERAPDDPSVRYELAIVLSDLGENRAAIEHLEATLGSGPKEAKAPLHTVIGVLYDGLGESDHAIEHYKKATELAPEEPEAFYDLGVALAGEGRHEEAAVQYRRILALDPDNADAANNLGAELFALGRPEDAAKRFEQALRAAPGDEETRRNLAMALREVGRVREAATMLEGWLDEGEGPVELVNLLAWLRATSKEAKLRDGKEALRLAERACAETSNENPYYLDTLAAAYAETGRFSDAAGTAKRAIGLIEDEGTRAAVERRITLYERGLPYRE